MGEMRIAYKNLAIKPEQKGLLWKRGANGKR
jgi:hypothetical protein